MTLEKNNHKIYFYAFLIAVVALAVMILWPLKDIILITWIILIVFNPVYVLLQKKFKIPAGFASALSILIVLITIILPLTLLMNLTISQFAVFYEDMQKVLSDGTGLTGTLAKVFGKLNSILDRFSFINFRLSTESATALIQSNISPILKTLLSTSLNFGVSFASKFPLVIVLIYLLWFGFKEYDHVIDYFKKLSPLPEVLDNMYLSRITIMIKGIISGTFSIAFIQGFIAWISIVITGVPYAFFWTLLIIFMSIIPLGSWLITVPLGLSLILLGNVWQGLVILGVQLVITSNIDNILRPILVPKGAEIHPALLLLGFIGGLQIFGLAGLMYGPIIMVITITTFEIYQTYFKVKE